MESLAYVPYLKTGQNHSQYALEERNLDFFQGRKIKNLIMSSGHKLGKHFSKFCIDFLHHDAYQLANFQFLFIAWKYLFWNFDVPKGDLNQKIDFLMQVLIKKTKTEFVMNSTQVY